MGLAVGGLAMPDPDASAVMMPMGLGFGTVGIGLLSAGLIARGSAKREIRQRYGL